MKTFGCTNCDDTGWVCEGHLDRPWKGASDRADACDCGAGTPCACVDDDVTPEELAEAAGIEIVPPSDKRH
jgi:hypothetical protein